MEQLNSTPSLLLGSGTHRLTRYTPVSSLLDIFIIGGGKSVVTVECDVGIGLSFVNVTRLTLCGFTIDGCGLTNESISTIEQQLKQVVMLWFGIPSVVSYGVVLGSCWNVTLSDLLITNTTGMGLLGINVMGDSIIQQVSFTNNVRLSCRSNPPRYPFDEQDKNILKQIGGGAYFLYQDEIANNIQDENIPVYNLVVRNCTFSRNAECSYAAITEQFPSFGQGPYQVGAGGGLSVFITQQNFNVYTLVENSTFTENDARYGAGAHIGVFAGVDLCTVIFRGCRFERNGAKALGVADANEPRSVGGSGVAIFTDMLSPNTKRGSLHIPEHNYSIVVHIVDTHFISNVAGVEGGGLLVYSLFNTPHRVRDLSEPGFYTILLNIENCVFHNNSAQYGVAAYFQQNVHQGAAGSVLLRVSNIVFSHSKAGVDVDLSNFMFLQEGQRITSALALVNMYMILRGEVVCSDNDVTGVLLQSTQVLVFEGSGFHVVRNRGQQGGGVHIAGEGSGVGFSRNTVLSFKNNTASIYGGAVYVSASIKSNDVLRPIDTATGCFISPFPRLSCFHNDCFRNALDNVSISFVGNTAPRGSAVYGATLEPCSWAMPFKNAGISTFQILYLARSIYGIEFDMNPNTSAVVSTPPANMSVLGPDNATKLNIFPGQSVNVSIEVFDQFGFTIPATVTSYVPGSSANSTLGSSGFFFAEDGANVTTLTVSGLEEQTFLVFFTELSTFVSANLTIHTKSCLQGFTYANASHRCVCNDQLIVQGVMCDLDNLKLVSPDRIWVGNLTVNASTEELVISTCYLGYCDVGLKPFRPPYYDEQCRKGSRRTGVVCGGCLPGYSVVLGNRECRKCTNISLLLIPLFGVLGIVLFVAIAFLEVTVEKGWMYSVLFYSNVVTLSSLTSSLPTRWNHMYIPAHLLSLELGIGICLYDGMEAIDRVFLKLLFPLYLFVLMFIFSLLSRKFTISSHFSPVKTFVTLGVMSYTSILDTCVEIVTATNLKTVMGEWHLRWLSDPNVVYFKDFRHGVLFLFAVVICATYLIPVPVVLLFPRVAFRYFKKIGPFFDALWAPFKPRYRWWLGVRLVLRGVLFFGTSYLPELGNIVSGLVLLIMIEIQFAIRPFKSEWVNILDSVMLGNIFALILGAFFFQNSTEDIGLYYRTAYVSATIFFVYALVFGILVHHFVVKWQLISTIKKRRETHSEETDHHEIHLENIETETEQDTNAPVTIVNAPSRSSLSVSPDDIPLSPAKADYSHFRESLLESQ